jgi:hypothetical protein
VAEAFDLELPNQHGSERSTVSGAG